MENQPNYKTPINKIYFRASMIGLLASGLIRFGLTETQHNDKKRLEALKIAPIGLTDKQQSLLDGLNKKLNEGTKLTPSQMEKRDDYTKRLITPKGLTDNQEETLKGYYYTESRPPELSTGAKTYIKSVWLENEKDFLEDVTSKYLKKGTQAEENAISLISKVDQKFYVKNIDKIFKGHLSGTCDVKHKNIEYDTNIVDDTKCSWNPRTFMSADLTTQYEWQGRAYLHLYDAEMFRLRHCLVNCPPDVFRTEYSKFRFQYNIIDDSLPEYEEAIKQFIRNHIYDFDTAMKTLNTSDLYDDVVYRFLPELEPKYTPNERVKTFYVERDYNLEDVMLKSIELGIEFYKTITLNMK